VPKIGRISEKIMKELKSLELKVIGSYLATNNLPIGCKLKTLHFEFRLAILPSVIIYYFMQ